MSLTSDGLVLAFATIAGIGSSILTSRHTKRTDAARAQIDEGALELDERRVDGEAIERAQRISQQIIESLRVELHRLEQTIEGLRSDLAGALQRNSELEVQNVQLATRNAQLEGHIRQLESSAAAMRELLSRADAQYRPGESKGEA